MTLEDLLAIEEIRQLKARYFHLMDRKRWDEWADVFCEDVLVDTTQEGSPLLEGRKAFVEFLPPILEGVKTVHHGHAAEIRVTGVDSASGTWSMEDRLFCPPEQGGRHLWGTGFYFEKYRKDADGHWRILEMKLRRSRTEGDGKQGVPPEDAEQPRDGPS